MRGKEEVVTPWAGVNIKLIHCEQPKLAAAILRQTKILKIEREKKKKYNLFIYFQNLYESSSYPGTRNISVSSVILPCEMSSTS